MDDLSLERLGDPDPEIRAAALDTLVRRGRQELGEKILEQSLTASNFDARSLNENAACLQPSRNFAANRCSTSSTNS